MWLSREFKRGHVFLAHGVVVDLAKVTEVYETNLFGPMAVTQAMLPLLHRCKHRRIVNVSSNLGSLGIGRQRYASEMTTTLNAGQPPEKGRIACPP